MAGIFDLLKLGGTLILAIPAALAGIEFLLRGDTLFGAILLGGAIALVLVTHYLTLPTDIPRLLAGRVLGSVVKEPETEPEIDEE